MSVRMVRPRRSDTVAEQILARGVPSGPGRSRRRSRRVSSRTATVPITGRETDRIPCAPTRMESRPVRETLLRSRNDSGPFPFFWKCGKPTRSPQREPFFEAEKAPCGRPRSTAASSNIWAQTSFRHDRPCSTSSASPDESTANTQPASFERFHPFHQLMREYPDHGTSASGRRRFSSRPSLSAARHRLKAKRRAPMCRRTLSDSTELSSAVNRNAGMRAIGRHRRRGV